MMFIFSTPHCVCVQLHRVSSVFPPTLFGWLGQDGYFWVDKAPWVTISIIILKPLSPRFNFNDGVRLLLCLKKPGLYDSEQSFHGKPRWKIGCCPVDPPNSSPPWARLWLLGITEHKFQEVGMPAKHERWSLIMEESFFMLRFGRGSFVWHIRFGH